MKPTGILFFPAFDWAISPTHPEREERLLYTRDQIFEEGIMDLPQVQEYQPGIASLRDIARVHFCVPDIPSRITEAHLISAGSSIRLADALMNGEIRNAFSIVRPPGHHSMTVVHGNRGFCNINNEAILVEYLRHKYGLKRIAIVDTDVHHGDGTQEIFYHDPDVLFISFHQDGRTLYPGTGFPDELGGPLAYGSTLNIPLRPRTTDEGILYVLENLVMPILEEFKPELVINSAGQDNHYTDPLADMQFTAQGYARLNARLAPDIAVLEGGYSVETALPYVNMGIIMAMAGIDFSQLREPDYSPGNFRESRANLEYLQGLVKRQLQVFRSREEVVAENRSKLEGFHSYYNQVFYDTDYIHEEQRVNLRICPSCCGYRTIDSEAQHHDRNYYRVLCVSVPASACEQCQQEAQAVYQDARENTHYDVVYLQNRIADEYRMANRLKETEQCI